MDNKPETAFQYTYSASEQQEIRRIRDKYVPRAESPLETLRRLDAGVTRKATGTALTVGVAGTLVMGTGMSLCMVIGGAWFFPGVAIGVAGMAIAALAYPLYERTLLRERERIAPQILALTDQQAE